MLEPSGFRVSDSLLYIFTKEFNNLDLIFSASNFTYELYIKVGVEVDVGISTVTELLYCILYSIQYTVSV